MSFYTATSAVTPEQVAISQQTGKESCVKVESRPAKWTKLGGRRLKFGELRWDLAGSGAQRRVNGCLKLLLQRSRSTAVDSGPPPVKLNQRLRLFADAPRAVMQFIIPKHTQGFIVIRRMSSLESADNRAESRSRVQM